MALVESRERTDHFDMSGEENKRVEPTNSHRYLRNVDLAMELDDIFESKEIENEKILKEAKSELRDIAQYVESAVKVANENCNLLKETIYDMRQRISVLNSEEEKASEVLGKIDQLDWQTRAHPITSLLIKCQPLLERIHDLLDRAQEDSSGVADSNISAKAAAKRQLKDEGRYELKIKSHENKILPAELQRVVYKALHNVPLQVDATKQTREGCTFIFKSLSEQCKAADVIRSYVKDRESYNDEITVEKVTKARHALRTDTFGRRITSKLSSMKDGKVDIQLAKTNLWKRNPAWFTSPVDVISVEIIHSNNSEDKYFLKILCSGPAHGRALKDARNGRQLDIEEARLRVYDATEVETCYRCHKPGHKQMDCQEQQVHCRYCLAKHESDGCHMKRNKALWECYHCRGYNINRKRDQDKRDEKHAANDPRCPTMREVIADLRKDRRVKKRKHV